MRALTQVLLKDRFDLDWTLPPDHLVPPVPNRANYIHWLEDMMDQEAAESSKRQHQPRPSSDSAGNRGREARRGIDVGV